CLSSVLICPFSCFFFFSSRRRHTRFSRDWSSDVCSSDLCAPARCPDRHRPAGTVARAHRPGQGRGRPATAPRTPPSRTAPAGFRSEERRVGKSVDLGGRRIIKKKTKVSSDATTWSQLADV